LSLGYQELLHKALQGADLLLVQESLMIELAAVAAVQVP
jgi:hypothetical protein